MLNWLICLGGTVILVACAPLPGTKPSAANPTQPGTLVVQAPRLDSLQDLFSNPDFIDRLLPSDEFGKVRVVQRPANNLANGQTRVVVVKRTVKKRVPRPEPNPVQIAVAPTDSTPTDSRPTVTSDQRAASQPEGQRSTAENATEPLQRMAAATTAEPLKPGPQKIAPSTEEPAAKPREPKPTAAAQVTAQTSQPTTAALQQRIQETAAKPPQVQPAKKHTQLAAAPTAPLKLDGLKQNTAIWPVRSKPVNTFGGKSPDGQAWRGLMFKSRAGQPVKAIADGKVVFAQGLRGYGNLIIVDHGRQFTSIYGYNRALNKHVGQTVRAGDTVAFTGNSGPIVDEGLYFEVRHKGAPINPLLYLKGSSAAM